MIRKAVSIQDIAHLAGVSHTTVSRALRDSPLISREVRLQIQQLAEEVGYVPNAVAQSLRGQHTNTIGLVVTTIADPFVGRVVRGIEEVAQRFHLSVFLSESKNDLEEEVAVIENFHRRRVDGVIVAAALLDAQHEQRLSRLNVPTVLINHQAESEVEQFHTISVDDYNGARQAVDHLLQMGHCKIGYLGAGNRPRSNRVRLQAYRETMAQAGIAVPDPWIQIAPPQRKFHSDDVCDGQEMLAKLIQAGVTAVFCYNDMVAVGALMTCRSLGIAVPSRFSIVGFDDIELAQFVSPALTTVHQPKLRLGRLAMEMLYALMEDRTVEDRVMPTELVVRGSSAPVLR
ncbi:MAG TPA: LacI family DNA-binding transcriptional regulator [Anaerolineaceae bacterium]|jgi:LacI family transcriptional regulator/LacI family repressor for deo operon, udp, cdd, tsx, nupC, and nupG